MAERVLAHETIGGLVIVKDDAAVVVRKPWVTEAEGAALARSLASQPGAVAAVGAFRLRNGTVLSAGDFLLHPKGLHFHMQEWCGLASHQMRRVESRPRHPQRNHIRSHNVRPHDGNTHARDSTITRCERARRHASRRSA